jgi:hypothetical protein
MANSLKIIAQAISAKLKREIEICNDNNTWFDDAELPFGGDPPPLQNSFAIVLDDGSFDRQWGGSPCSLKMTQGVTISHLQRWEQDNTKQLSRVIADSETSMLDFAYQILSTVLTESHPNNILVPWVPTDEDGKQLFDSIRAVSYVSPKRHQNWPLLYQYIKFELTLSWDL